MKNLLTKMVGLKTYKIVFIDGTEKEIKARDYLSIATHIIKQQIRGKATTVKELYVLRRGGGWHKCPQSAGL